MGMYLNQLPPTEVARLKAEIAETLIAHFCYPRFFDYRTGRLRMRPVDRAKRQEVWQYLNAVDFNVWGRVDVDSPDFQRQVERLFIHFVQRNRSFFGEQGRKRMTDVRTLITTCSTALADGLRGHLRGQMASPPFGTPRPVFSWSGGRGANAPDLSWEQVLASTMQVQQHLQEARGEVPVAVPPTPSMPSMPPTVPPTPVPTPSARATGVPSRRSRMPRPTPTGGSRSNGSGVREEEAIVWPAVRKGAHTSGEVRYPAPAGGAGALYGSSSDASPTMPLPLGKPEQTPAPVPVAAETPPPLRSRRSRSASAEIPAASPAPPSGPVPRALSQPLAFATTAIPARPSQPLAVPVSVDLGVKSAESATALTGDEDVVIFEQMRHQLVVWLRVEAVHAGIDPSTLGAFQLVEALRQQDDVDTTRLQIVSTLLGVCDQVVNSGRASLFDYKQAMMFYLMHTRRGR